MLLSRVLVWLVAAILLVIPWSERYSMLDNFPHGQDTEFSVLAFLIFIGLMLLLARSCTSFLSTLMTWCEALSAFVHSGWSLLRAFQLCLTLTTGPQHPPDTSPGAFNLPLQI